MRILYAIQGTGNGHLSRALDIIPHLRKHVELDLLVSGMHADPELPYPIWYRIKGFGYYFGKNGGIDLWKTWWRASLWKLFKDIATLPVERYDLIISDFEPVSAWACWLKGKKSVGLSHQSAVLHQTGTRFNIKFNFE